MQFGRPWSLLSTVCLGLVLAASSLAASSLAASSLVSEARAQAPLSAVPASSPSPGPAPSAQTAGPPTAAPMPPPTQAACRAPQATRRAPGQMLVVDSPQGQADDWAAWMTEQIALGRTRFITVPFKPTGKDEDGSDGPADAPLGVLCAW